MDDLDVAYQADSFLGWCSKFRHPVQPTSAMFRSWAAGKDLQPADREAIWREVRGRNAGAA